MKTAVIYWSGTGNTEAMAKAVAEGANGELFAASEFKGSAADYDNFAFGCPAMGAEELEDSEFEPLFARLEGELSGKSVALFGSYGWGDGEWMRNWADRTVSAGAKIAGGEGLIVNGTPSASDLADCKALGEKLISES
jgi:flavodoxin short chain